MNRRAIDRLVLTGTLTAGLLSTGSWTAAQTSPSPADYVAQRAERAQGLTTPFGWFSLIALDWLKPGVTTVGSAKENSVILPQAPAHLMTLDQVDGRVLPTGMAPGVTLHGQAVALHQPLGDDEDDAAALSAGTMRFWVIDRGGKRYLRVKDSNAPALKHFHGLRWYEPAARYRVEARWVPFAAPHTLRFLNQLGQVSDVEEPGQAEFTLDGKRYTLTPLSATDKGLWFVFRDLTSARETDRGGRFLYTDAPSHGVNSPGTVTLDFNDAVNPPCAYSPFATCPLAAVENRLPVAVPAGEKRYEE
jgi:uncharacterized protein (DUF1684 family)